MKTCGNCIHFRARVRTPTGRPKKDHAADCGAVFQVGALPMCVEIVISKKYIWAKNDAEKCPHHEASSSSN